MKNKHSLIVSISNINDLDKITKDTKYINLNITNPDNEVIEYFIKHGLPYMFSDLIMSTSGYNYVGYEEFVKAENIIDAIYEDMPKNLNELEIAKYLYVTICKYVSLDINTDQNKTETYNSSHAFLINWSTSCPDSFKRFSLPKRIFSRIVLLNKTGSCSTYPIKFLKY